MATTASLDVRSDFPILGDLAYLDSAATSQKPEVVIQAMVMVFAIAGLFKWISDGATLDQSVIDGWEDDPPTWTGSIGHFIHVMNGQFLIPLLGIALLIVSFFAAVNGASSGPRSSWHRSWCRSSRG